MNVVPFKYIANTFGNFDDISITGSMYADLFAILGDGYAPTTIQELTPFGQKNRIVMDNLDIGIKIIFLTQSILIEKATTNSMGEFAEFCIFVSDILEKLMIKFNKKSNRLAFTTKYLLSDTALDESTLINKLFKFPKNYTSNEFFEWNWRMVRHEECVFSGLNETVNHLSSLNRIKGQLFNAGQVQEFDGIDVELEMNTRLENSETRFNSTKIKEFYLEASKWQSVHYTSIINFIRE